MKDSRRGGKLQRTREAHQKRLLYATRQAGPPLTLGSVSFVL